MALESCYLIVRRSRVAEPCVTCLHHLSHFISSRKRIISHHHRHHNKCQYCTIRYFEKERQTVFIALCIILLELSHFIIICWWCV